MSHASSPFDLSGRRAAIVTGGNGGIGRAIALRHWGKADETVRAAIFLASQTAEFIIGVTLPVNGGYSIF